MIFLQELILEAISRQRVKIIINDDNFNLSETLNRMTLQALLNIKIIIEDEDNNDFDCVEK